MQGPRGDHVGRLGREGNEPALTKQLDCPLLATAPFAASAAGRWRPVGEHVLRGLETPIPILTMAT